MSDKSGYASLCIRVLFSGLLLVHIPYIFLPCKESILLIYFECKQRFLSSHLDQKLAEEHEATKKTEKENESQEEDENDALIAKKYMKNIQKRTKEPNNQNENYKGNDSEGSDKAEGIEVEKRTQD